jgi:hypothetical protein
MSERNILRNGCQRETLVLRSGSQKLDVRRSISFQGWSAR